ncbi:ABC-2 transporter permease [Kitasatospora sp. NPDC002227]|uniref:ABC-2 transporter permease n=1 Tax=Kitasatospora sp. NPDC002227 TaxID=3154773 RepID=UPI0033348DD7
MSAVARVAVLHLRTVAPYRAQGLMVFGLIVLVLARTPAGLVPALALLLAPMLAVHPFVIADKAGLDVLHAVLPVPRRAVVLAYYAWALASFLALVTAGAAVAVLLAQLQGQALDPASLATPLTLSWALFGVNIAIQLPLLVRFGYARASVLGTTVPFALVMIAVVRLHLTLGSVQSWLPLFWVLGAVAVAGSAAVAVRLRGLR